MFSLETVPDDLQCPSFFSQFFHFSPASVTTADRFDFGISRRFAAHRRRRFSLVQPDGLVLNGASVYRRQPTEKASGFDQGHGPTVDRCERLALHWE